MPDTRLTGLMRHFQTGLGPAFADQSDGDALRSFIAYKDESAFATLVQRHGAMVQRVCQRVLHHTQDSEDAFQATFLVLARKAAAIGKADSLASWLHGVAYRVALRARRDAARRRVRESQALALPRPDPVDAPAWHDVQILLEAEIERLPERYRSAFVLCYLAGRSRADAAEELGIQENTLSSRLARARDRLQKRLARRGVSLSAVLAAIALTTTSTGATIPLTLVETTAHAASLIATRQPLAGISSSTLQLTNEAMRTMTIAKLKWAFGAMALGTTLAVGAWGAGQGPGLGGPPTGAPPIATESEEKPDAVDRVADYPQRQRSLNNLKQIVLAMQNYYTANEKFPADITDKDGKPLLSWRVELLPYLEQENLYQQFNRKESWDSEHNLKLLAKMPAVFRVGFEPKDSTHTHYQRFAIVGIWGNYNEGGAGAGGLMGPTGSGGGPPPAGGAVPLLPGPMGTATTPSSTTARFPLKITEITDGTSYTLGVIEAGPPVPWSKPADIAYDAKKPLPAMTGPFANVRNAAMYDGTAYCFKPNLDETTLRRLIEPNDGNVLPELKTLRARFPADSGEEKKALAKKLEENQALIAALEEQIAEHAALLALGNKLTKDVDKAEEEQDRIKRMLDNLKLMNKKLRDEFGIGSGKAIPKG